ncbi:U3-containing 90S pre-ribosomal complex subunit-domain containing protein [Gaertneriomyces semiglobifer]|nr:U3-containing 90S pre-ribosomal complex subunit-domain containing protein [Gaertneriomyces semiglobifer]
MSKVHESADALGGDDFVDDFIPADDDEDGISLDGDGQEAHSNRKRKVDEAEIGLDGQNGSETLVEGEEQDKQEPVGEPEKKKQKKQKKPKAPRREADPTALFVEQGIPLVDTTSFGSERTDEQLVSFLREFLYEKNKNAFSEATTKTLSPGSPKVLIVSPSAIRSVQIIKPLRSLGKHVRVAKLFAKHLKVHEQIALLQTERTPVAVGTPNRVQKLLEVGEGGAPLKLDHLEYIVIDGTHRDKKERTIFTVPEVKNDLVPLFRTLRERKPDVKFAIY